jgi:glycosyltransferase involved in cell wall biosynthesis
VVVVMNPPDPRLFKGSTPERDPSNRTLLYTGTLGVQYGVDVAIRAVAALHNEIPGLRLRVVAKNTGADLDDLERLARELGVAERVSLEPPVPLDRIPAIAAEAWLGVQPGRDDPLMRYSLSAKILEWCRLGLPVIAGKTVPLGELLDDEDVLFHPLGDLDGLCACIREAHGDPAGLARRAVRAREAAAVVSYDREMARYLALVEGRSEP